MKRKVNPRKDEFNFCDRITGAVNAGDLEDVKFLLNDNPLLSTVGEDKDLSVLEIALRNQDVEVAVLLREAGASIQKISPDKQSQYKSIIDESDSKLKEKKDFIHSVSSNNTPGVRDHIHKNKDLVNSKIEQFSCNAMSILQFTIGLGNNEMSTLLIENGADVNEVLNDSHVSLLHLAAKKGNREIYNCLIDHGAKKDIRDTDRKTAAEVLKENTRSYWEDTVTQRSNSECCIMM